MDNRDIVVNIDVLLSHLKLYKTKRLNRKIYAKNILDKCKAIIKIEQLENEKIIEYIIDIYDNFQNKKEQDILTYLSTSNIEEILVTYQKEIANYCYGTLQIKHESFKLKTILYCENDCKEKEIFYMAGSFYTDQEYRTFLATIQKGTKRNIFTPVENRYGGINNLQTFKDGYISRVKKSINGNIQDGYHADFIQNNGRFFLLKVNDNPVDIIYNWIVKNTQAAILPNWKTFLYNSLHHKGLISECTGYNYSGTELKGLVLSDKVTTDMIREIRKEGLGIGEISIPGKPIKLDPSMSFIEAMNRFIIPYITERRNLYNVGEEISPIIDSPIIYKKNYKIKKTYLYPRQKVIAQGLLNGVREGRRSLILNGGMGIGKTYISIKTAYAIIKEHFNKDSGRIAIYAQSHLIPKWQRQFIEALPDVPLKFFQINGYKDVMDIVESKPEGIEVYLLPKDRVKRKYLEEFASNERYRISSNFYKKFSEITNKEPNNSQNIYVVDEIKPSEMRLLARRLQKHFNHWICVAQKVFNEEGEIVGYRVTTTSKILREKLGQGNTYYDFYVKELGEFIKYKDELEDEEKISSSLNNYYPSKITCPCCGGPIYDKEESQLSEDDKNDFLTYSPTIKSERNKKCTNYIKIDGTPLTARERKLLIKREIDYIIDEKAEYPYLDSYDNPITDFDTLQKIKQGRFEESYTIVLKRCNNSLWAAKDKKGYRTVNSLDMLKRRFGKNYFLCQISDESHLYSAESSQGETFAKLCRMSKVNIALTGTLTGGKSSHMFYALYRMIPHKMSKYYKYNEVAKFIDHYGRRKKVTKEYKNDDKYNKSGQGKITSSGWNEIPGISPMLYSHFLSDIMLSRKIEDMGYESIMPELKFYKHDIEMNEVLRKGYDKLKSDIISFMKNNRHLNLGGTYLNALLSYPDIPLTKPLMYNDMIISNPDPIDIENIILPKEQKLIDTLKRERQLGRRSVVYVTYTGEKEVDKRVEKVLTKSGFKVALLKSNVGTEKREKWIEDRYKDGIEVIICNPKLVQTGLDIIGYPTLIFYQLDYDVRIVRQAESRAWRVGQEKVCKVIYMAYSNSIQYDALKLIGSKKKASLALEGVIAEDILSDMAEDMGDSGMAALYKSLLGKVKLKEDDLDFFSEEEVIEIIEEVEKEKTKEEPHIYQEDKCYETQLSLFTITEEIYKRSSTKTKRKVSIGQVSMFKL